MARYPQATVQYLRTVYVGQADAGTLAELAGRSYEQLDAEYRQFLEPPGGIQK